jgi:IS5 family transposase
MAVLKTERGVRLCERDRVFHVLNEVARPSPSAKRTSSSEVEWLRKRNRHVLLAHVRARRARPIRHPRWSAVGRRWTRHGTIRPEGLAHSGNGLLAGYPLCRLWGAASRVRAFGAASRP